MVNTPIPHSLKSEAKKAAKILRDFTIPSAKTGPDKIIPAGILANAEGLAILTVVKIGFLVTARGGSGIVIAKLNDGRWSAPSAIGIAGLGGGFEVGAEVTDFVIILNKRSAVEAFSKGGNLTLGGNFTIAAGPLGRNMEGDISVRSPAAIYTYSKTKGLFAGISIEGSYLVERKDANKKFYCEDIRASEILSGMIEPPKGCEELYDILAQHKTMYEDFLEAKAKRDAVKSSFGRVQSMRQSSRSTGSGSVNTRSRSITDINNPYGSRDLDSDDDVGARARKPGTSKGMTRSYSLRPASSAPPTKAPGSRQNVAGGVDWNNIPLCEAVWSFKGQLPCDLSFKAGDRIEIRTRTGKQDDWWEGVINGRIGIFPANYVKVL